MKDMTTVQSIRVGVTIMVALAMLCHPATMVAQEVAENAPCLEVDPPVWECGVMVEGDRQELEFRITNPCPEEIRLNYIHAECDCTLTVPDGGVVPGQGEYLLVVQLHLDDFAPGRLEESITIFTDHPGQPVLRIPVTAMVKAVQDRSVCSHPGG